MFAANKTSKKSEDAWLDTVVEKGTMSDRLSAIQLKFQKDPVHSLGYLERIVGMLEKKKMRDAINLFSELPLFTSCFLLSRLQNA